MHQSAKRIFEQATEEHWAIGAFNVANQETLKAIFAAAQKLEAPVIIESSPGETEYFGAEALSYLVNLYKDQYGVTAFLNLDHAVTLEQATLGLKAQYDLIHLDGGQLEFEENIKLASAVARQAHELQRMVEGEIDHIGGSSNDHRGDQPSSAQDQSKYTDPARAREFVKRTGIDTLAVFIGNVHGLYKTAPKLDLDRLQQIHDNVDVYLSLHGGSGIAKKDIKEAVLRGIVKVNVNSELRIAYVESLKMALSKTDEVAAYKLMPPVIAAVQKVVEEKIKMFGSVGKAKQGWVRRSIT